MMKWTPESFAVPTEARKTPDRKPCTQCGQLHDIRDRHAKCQKCRQQGGYKKYRA